MHKFVMLSNWNEYGEGTYLCPHAQYGFGHIEAVKNVFTEGHDDGINHNIKPSANQLKRLSTLYPQERRMLRCSDTEEKAKNISFIPEKCKVLDMDPVHGNWTMDQMDEIKTDGTTIKGVSNDSDAKFEYHGELDISCDEANVIKFTLDSSASETVCIYYTTTDSPNWGPVNKTVITIFGGKHEYCVPLKAGTRRIRPYDSPSKTYSGKLTGIRIDPSTSSGVTSELIRCGLYHESTDELEGHLFIDGKDMVLDNDFVIKNGHYMVPIFPERCILLSLNAFYKYNAQKKLLSIFAQGKSIEFEIGTRKAKINGEVVSLDVIPYFYNGLPMVPFDIMCDVFGYKFEYKNMNIYVTTL